MSILTRIDDGTWQEAFNFAGFGREDVETIPAIDNGASDFDISWVGVFRFRDGSFGYLSVEWHNYDGWGCPVDGAYSRGNTLENILVYMTESDWDRLGDQLAPFMS